MNFGQVPVISTSRDPAQGRLKVESGSTAFAMGKAFRAYTTGSLTNGAVQAFEIITPINVDVTSIVLNVSAGEILYQGIVLPTSATGFTIPRNATKLNNRTDAGEPAYVAQLTVTTGGVIVGGTEIDYAVVRTGTNNQRSSIVEEAQSRRGAAPGTYYIQLTAGTNGADFTLYATWEEYP